jgi:predicted RNA-binding Zn-ribbon protein involved in translation (DUF1610 family)
VGRATGLDGSDGTDNADLFYRMDEIEDDDAGESEESISLQVSLSTDKGKFFRRTCPSCGLDFKTEIEEGQLSWLLAEEVRRQLPDFEGSASEASGSSFICPYCGNLFSWKESFTEETIEYAKRIINRDYVLPMLDRTFGNLEDGNSRGARHGGFLSLSVRFEYHRPPRPPRPIHGPEPPDMTIVKFLCCGREAKIRDGWFGVSFCIFCQTPVAIR